MIGGQYPRVVIVGGGFTGAAVATHLALGTSRPMQIEIVEPRAVVGAGVAYSSIDPAHRTNVTSTRMSLFTADEQHFDRWLGETGALADDPDAILPDGRTYPRRAVFGRYIADALERVAVGSLAELAHVRDRAVGMMRQPSGWVVELASGGRLSADLVVLAVSHPPPVPPIEVSRSLSGHAKFIADPWQPDGLLSISPIDKVIRMGTALSMADVVASLELRGHRGAITAFSRRGLLSRPHAAAPHQPFGDFTASSSHSARALLRAVRRELRLAQSAGQPWQAVVDALRRDGQAIWSGLCDVERYRLLRHLRPYWEVHRYRIAPQIARVIEGRRAAGTLSVLAAKLVSVERAGERIRCALQPRNGRSEPMRWLEADAFVLTTGPGHAGVVGSNPVLRRLAADGWIAPDPFGLGLSVDRQHRALGPNGRAAPELLVAGPLARGTFGELMGLPQVTRNAEAVAAAALGRLSETSLRSMLMNRGDRGPVDSPSAAHRHAVATSAAGQRPRGRLTSTLPGSSRAPAIANHEELLMRTPSVLGIAGSVRQPSRTTALVTAVVDAIAERLDTRGRTIELGDRGASFFDVLHRDAIRGRALEIVEAIEDADVLVVGTPVYRASYTGLFKHVFDLVHHEALVGRTVVLTATGGSPLHGLVMEHQLRPLFGFFRAHTMPSAVYATEADFDHYTLTSPTVRERVARAAEETARLFAPGRLPVADAHLASIAAMA